MAGKIEVTVNKNNNQVILTQNTTNVVQVNTPGPRGTDGAVGATGPQADPGSITGSLHLTGSLIVSSSYVDFTNATAISGSTFSGSFVGDGSGITGVTAEWDGSHTGTATFTGNITASGDISSSGTITANEFNVGTGKIYGNEAYNNYLDFNVSSSLFKVQNKTYIKFDGSSAQREVTVNEGTNDINFVVKGASNNPLFKTVSSTNKIGMHGVGTPEADLHLGGNLKTNSHITASGHISSSGTITGLTGSFSHLKGNSPITVGAPVTFNHPVTASIFSGSFVGDASGLTNTSVPSGTISSSAQISTEISGAFTTVSGGFSTRVTANEVIVAKTLVSSSSQITYSSISSIPSNIVSSSAQIASDISGSFTVASGGFSTRVTANEVITAKTLVSSSAQITYSSISSIPSGIYSSSLQTIGNITSSGTISATGQISSSGNIYGSILYTDRRLYTNGDITINNSGNETTIGVATNKTEIDGTNIHLDGPVTASGNITATGNISASGDSNYLGGSLTLTSTADTIFTILDNTGGEQHALHGRGNVNSYLAIGTAVNLGIGTSNPSQKLNVHGNLYVSGSGLGHITASGNIRSNGTITANTFVGDGSELTGISAGGSGIFTATGSIYSTSNDLRITGSVFIDDTTTNSGSADANSVFKVKGTLGNLLTVTNDMSDDLLNIKDISGVTLFKVSGSGEVLMKDLPTTEPNITGSLWISGSSVAHPSSGYLMVFKG